MGRPSAAPNKRPDRDRGGDKGGRKPAGGPSNKPSRDARPVDRGRGQPKGDRDKGGAKKEHKVSYLSFKCSIEGLYDQCEKPNQEGRCDWQETLLQVVSCHSKQSYM